MEVFDQKKTVNLKSFYDFSLLDLEHLLIKNQLHTSAASHLYNWYYKKKEKGECRLKISEKTKSFLKENLSFDELKIDSVYESADKTVKFLFTLFDGNKVETVLIPFQGKYSICISSQVGCAMNCSFCFTGTQGFKRSLKVSEIIGQYMGAYIWLKKNRPEEYWISNVVYMGQGEPLHNFDAVKKSCEIFTSQNGLSVGLQKITVSTSGYLPGLEKWRKSPLNVNLALSLHSPYTEKRNELIPINRKYPLNEVLQCIDKLPLAKKQFVTYEYLLIKDFNDDVSDAHQVGLLLKDRRAYINLIPFNPFPGSHYERPSLEAINNFKSVLDEYKVPTIIRTTKGDEILAACGQLNTKE